MILVRDLDSMEKAAYDLAKRMVTMVLPMKMTPEEIQVASFALEIAIEAVEQVADDKDIPLYNRQLVLDVIEAGDDN